MINQSYEEFISADENGSGTKKQEYFRIQSCPTPGCGSRVIRPVYHNLILTDFTCNHGCTYHAKRNKISKEIDYFELATYNQHMIGETVPDHRVTASGQPVCKWH